MGRRWATVLATGLAAVLLSACGSAGSATPAGGGGAAAGGGTTPRATTAAANPAAAATAPRAQDRVAIGWVRSVNAAALNVAMGRGYFTEEGINLVTEEFASAADIVAALGTGQLDVNSGTVAAGTFNAWQRGVKMIVGAPQSEMPANDLMSQNVVVRKALYDSGEVRSAADFRGRKVAMNVKGGINEFLVVKVLERRGLQLSDVDAVLLPYPDQVTALANSSIDVLTGNEPFGTQAIDLGIGVRLNEDQMSPIPNFQPTHFLFSEQFSTTRGAVATRFLIAIVRANRDLQGDWLKQPTLTKIIGDEVGIKPELIEKTVFPAFPPSPRTSVADLQQLQDTFMRLGQLTYQQTIDPTPFVNNQLVEEAARQLDARR